MTAAHIDRSASQAQGAKPDPHITPEERERLGIPADYVEVVRSEHVQEYFPPDEIGPDGEPLPLSQKMSDQIWEVIEEHLARNPELVQKRWEEAVRRVNTRKAAEEGTA